MFTSKRETQSPIALQATGQPGIKPERNKPLMELSHPIIRILKVV